jgi:hypothetical protein
VHQLFLIGSPTLGAPTAYLQLKNGVNGLYIKDIKDDIMEGDTKGAALELLQAGGSLFSMVSALSTGQGLGDKMKGAAKTFFGDLYGLLCLGAGRCLSRKETTYFVRQLPSIYQLMPGSIYCRDNKNWVLFDPFATGHPPTGKMLVLPTLLDAGLELVGGALDLFSGPAQKIGTELKDEVQGFLAPEQSERTSGRAKRNVKTLAEKLASIGEGLKHTPFDETEEGEPEPEKDMFDAIGEIVEIFERVAQSFVDCVNPGRFYNDIYTGLLDVVELRAVCAGNLALAYRFDKAVTVRPRDEKAESPLDLIAKLLEPMLNAWKIDVGEPLRAFGEAVGNALWHDWDYDYDKRIDRIRTERRDAEAREKRAKEERERTKARAYVHPRTINVYCPTHQSEAGCFLVPTAILSNDDSNVVRWAMIPNFIALSMFILTPGGPSMGAFEASAMGDGTVPLRSANPGADSLSRPLLENHEVAGVFHADMMSHAEVVDYLKRKVQGLVMGFYRT